MGVYDIYGETGMQLKIAEECEMRVFNVGDEVNIPDGVYVAFEGVIVVKDGVFVAEFDHLTDKWGGEIEPKAVIEDLNPVKQAVDAAAQQYRNQEKNDGSTSRKNCKL